MSAEDHYHNEYELPAEQAAEAQRLLDAAQGISPEQRAEYDKQKREYRKLQYKALAMSHALDLVVSTLKYSCIVAATASIVKVIWT